MFTSVIDDRRAYFNCFDTARICVLIAVNVAVFSAIYEHFSFGVYSPFMIFAFAVPLLGGALAYLLLGLALKRTQKSIPSLACKFWNAAVAVLTVGCLFRGVLEIYGTNSPLTAVYWVASGLLAALSLLTAALTSCWR